MYYFIFIFFFLTAAQQAEADLISDIQTALNLGNSSLNYTREGCIWRANNDPRSCPDPDLHFYLYTPQSHKRQKFDLTQADWLQHSGWDPALDNVVLVHGYAGGDNTFPMSMLRDAYIRNGSYNVIMLDWGGMAPLPCYPAAVHNTRTAARCSAPVFKLLRDHSLGGREKITCVGHSLGAHVCGLIGEFLLFRMHKIIGMYVYSSQGMLTMGLELGVVALTRLSPPSPSPRESPLRAGLTWAYEEQHFHVLPGLDPARPLIRNSNQLRPGSAEIVQVIHSNAGTYGLGGRLGKVDICLNGGKTQPLCELQLEMDLCSHVMALCFMAASIDSRTAVIAHPCARRCPSGARPTQRLGVPIVIGEHTPQSASGFYCATTSKKPPYCPAKPGDPGHPWCCLDESSNQQTLETPHPPLTAGEAAEEAAEKEESPKKAFGGAPTFLFNDK